MKYTLPSIYCCQYYAELQICIFLFTMHLKVNEFDSNPSRGRQWRPRSLLLNCNQAGKPQRCLLARPLGGDTLSQPCGGRKTEDRGLYTCRRSLKTDRLLFPLGHKNPACFSAGASVVQTVPHHVSPVSRASRYNTLHLASKVVCQRGGISPPFGNPRFCQSVATVCNPASVSPPLQNPKKRRRPAYPYRLICAASLFGLRAGKGEKRIGKIVFAGCVFYKSGLQ